MRKKLHKILSIVLCSAAVFSAAAVTAACGGLENDEPPVIEQTEPQKLKDGEAVSLTADGAGKNITVADYIKANGKTVTVSSSAPDKVTATLSGGVVALKPVAEGTATVTLVCGDVSVTFAVTVNAKPVTPPTPTQKCTVTLNGEAHQVDKGGTFSLPETYTPEDDDFEFAGWDITGEHTLDGNTVTVNGNLTITAKTRRKAAVKIKDGISLSFTVGDEAKTVTVSEYITTHGNIVTANSSATDKIAVALTDGVVTLTPAAEGTATVTLACGDISVTFAVTVGAAQIVVPSVKKATVEISETYDLYRGDYTVNLADNIENANLITGYKVDSQPVDGTSYTVSGGSYTATPTLVTLQVTAEYEGGTLNYVYKVNVIDSTAYRIVNGDFENDLEGWKKIGEIGNISSETAYWKNENGGVGYSFNADGKFFSAYEPDDKFERNIGALISSPFKVAQNRIITFKLGGAQHDIFVDVIEQDTGNIIARYGNSAWQETTDGQKSGCTLNAYKAVLPQAAAGKTVYIRVIDMAESHYGVLFCDSFVTFYQEEPNEGFTAAIDITDHPATVYDIYNGGFEKDMAGWSLSGGDIGAVTSDKCYWNNGHHEAVAGDAGVDSNAKNYGQEDTKLFSWWSWEGNKKTDENPGHEVNREGNMGTLTSNMFVLKNDKFVSFMLGGANRNVYVELVNAESGTVMAVFHNDNAEDGVLKRYHYSVTDLTKETLCYFRVVDVAVSGWGCFTADGFKVNLDAAPENSTPTTNRLSEYKAMNNGSFESGLDGWTAPEVNGNECALGGVVENEPTDLDYYQTNESTKDERKLFTFAPGGNNKENGMGVIRSSAFILEKNGIVSFRFGAAHNENVYINVYTAGGKLLATFRNNAYKQATVMVQYYYQFDNTEEMSCYFEVVDNATNNYGCVVMDDFRVNLANAPENAVLGSALTKAERDAQQQQ